MHKAGSGLCHACPSVTGGVSAASVSDGPPGMQADRQRSQARASTQESTDRARAEAQRQSQGAEERAQRAKATAEAGAKKINDDVEEMLQQMKRDLGIK